MWAFASTTEYVIVATGALVHTVADGWLILPIGL